MADVDDRGQLLLVGALSLAVMLVALAVLLNAAIYTDNVATRDAGPGVGAAIEYENEATSMAQSTIDALNERENVTKKELRRNFTDTVDVWSDTARAHSAASLSDAEVEVTDVRIDRNQTYSMSADLELTYRTADIYYQTEFTVASGEDDD